MVIYRVTNIANGKIYIGKWRGESLKRRWQLHIAEARRGEACPYFHNAIRKYGPDAFTVESIYTAKTDEELAKMETFFIVLHQSHIPENGYNLTMGGEGVIPNEATRQKQRKAKLGKKHSVEHRRRNSESKQDVPLSQYHRQRISESLKDRKFSPTHRANLSKACEGREDSEITRRRKAVGTKNREGQGVIIQKMHSVWRGGHHSIEARKAISEAKKRYWKAWREARRVAVPATI